MSSTRGTLVVAVLGLLALSGCGQGGTGEAADATEPYATFEVDEAPPATLVPGDPTTPSEDGMAPDEQGTTRPEPSTPLPTLGAAELPAAPTGVELTLVPQVGPEGPGQPPVVLSCDWSAGTVGGNHPQAEQACADLQAAVQAGNPFAPVPPDALCTQQYGGDAVVEVSGAVLGEDGGPVDLQARFSLTDGCEIARWEQMGAVLAPYRGDV